MRLSPKLSDCQSRMEIAFGGEPVVLDASGTLYLAAHGVLVVADLHLEKGSFFAARGNPVPRHDTRDTLQRLGKAIAAYRPETVICLGDSFHDMAAGERMTLPDTLMLPKADGEFRLLDLADRQSRSGDPGSLRRHDRGLP